MLSYPYIWEWCYKRTNKQAKKLPFVTSSCGYHPDCANSFQKKSLQMIVKCPARELTETRKRDHISYRLDSAQSDRAFFFIPTLLEMLALRILQCKAQWDTCPLWTDIIWMKLNQTELQPLFPANSKHFFITWIILTLKCAVLWGGWMQNKFRKVSKENQERLQSNCTKQPRGLKEEVYRCFLSNLTELERISRKEWHTLPIVRCKKFNSVQFF